MLLRSALEHARPLHDSADVQLSCSFQASGLLITLHSGRLFLDMPLASGDIDDILESSEVPLLLVPVLERLMQEPELAKLDGATDALKALLAEAHDNTWFAVNGAGEAARSKKGTRPGNPLADLLFALLVDPALRDIEADVSRVGWALDLDADLNVFCSPGDSPDNSATNTAYADDVVTAALAPLHLGPEATLEVARHVVAIVARRFLERGLLLNPAPGKSELLLIPVGAGSKALLRIILPPSGRCEVSVTGLGEVGVVSSYRHIGSM